LYSIPADLHKPKKKHLKVNSVFMLPRDYSLVQEVQQMLVAAAVAKLLEANNSSK
jgi:hypothetical protein